METDGADVTVEDPGTDCNMTRTFREEITRILTGTGTARSSGGFEKECETAVEFRNGVQKALNQIFYHLRYMYYIHRYILNF